MGKRKRKKRRRSNSRRVREINDVRDAWEDKVGGIR